MGYSTWIGLGVALLAFPQVVKAESAPPPAPQWTTPAASAANSPPGLPPRPTASAAAPPAMPAPGPPPATPAPSSPAPAAEPTLAAPPPPPPGPPAGPRPPAYGAPYPGGYAPPPPGYEYAYYYPPLPPAPKLHYPGDAAVSSSPFVDAVLVGVSWQNRFSEFLNIGAQVGMFVQGRLRLSARIAFPADTVRDDYGGGFASGAKSYGFVWGGSLGVAAVSTASFALSPGIAFGRSDVSDYGSTLGLSLPFDWVLGSGVRIGLDLELGRAFGGRYLVDCQFGGSCMPGFQDRPAGTAFAMQFHFGFGINHPAPLPPPQAPPPAAWPPPAPPPAAR